MSAEMTRIHPENTKISKSSLSAERRLRREIGSGVTFFCRLKLIKGDLRDLAASEVVFRNCYFDGSDFSGAIFTKVRFFDCIFTKATLEDVTFVDCTFLRCDFSGTDWNGVTCERSVFKESGFVKSDMMCSWFSQTDFQKCDFSSATFAGMNLTEAIFSEDDWLDLLPTDLYDSLDDVCDVHWTEKVRSDAYTLRFMECNFSGICLDGANLTGVYLASLDLTRASFKGACLMDAKFINSRLIGARLQKANLVRTDFRSAKVINAFWSGATIYLNKVDGMVLKFTQKGRRKKIHEAFRLAMHGVCTI